jgi:hypothetical protein
MRRTKVTKAAQSPVVRRDLEGATALSDRDGFASGVGRSAYSPTASCDEPGSGGEK